MTAVMLDVVQTGRGIKVVTDPIRDHLLTDEDAFIDLAFELGDIEGMSAAQVKACIRDIADRRLPQLGLEPIYRLDRNPLPWLEDMLNGAEHSNFFETRATEYSKAATRGTWEEAFD